MSAHSDRLDALKERLVALGAGFVFDRYEEAKAEGDDQHRFDRNVARDFSRLSGLSDDVRDEILALKAELARDIEVHLIKASEVTEAQRICGRILDDLNRDPRGAAMRHVAETWPSVIAHEVARLLADMAGHPATAGGIALPPSPEAALFQLRDVFETLVKFPALVLARALLAQGTPEDGRFVRKACFDRLSTGSWIGIARDAARRVTAVPALVPLHALASLFHTAHPFYRAVDGFTNLRNDEIGHGAHRLDPRETAKLLRVAVLGDIALAAELKLPAVPSLADALAAATAADPWHGLSLVAEDAGATIRLMGAADLSGWHGEPDHHPERHQAREVPLRLDMAAGASLDLGPFMRGRICSKCDHRDIFLYDSLYDRHGAGIFDLMDYGRGHKMRPHGKLLGDLGEAFRPPYGEEPAVPGAEGALSNRKVVEALDAARVERHYLSPRYLRQPFARFLGEHRRGVYWLQAPAHIGKTTFVQGLVPARDRQETTLDTPIAPDEDPVAVAAYFCKKEYREGVKSFLNGLEHELKLALQIRWDANTDFPPATLALHADDKPQHLVAWIDTWRDLAAAQHRLSVRPRLLVIVDGLDETDAPGDPESLLHWLPAPEMLSDGLYLLLTSRPPQDKDCPGWLASALPALAGPEGWIEPVTLETPAYRGLMRRYAAERLGRPGDDPDFQALFDQLCRKADNRFVYLSFLVDRLDQRRLAADRIEDLGVGDALYDDFLDGLGAEFHPKFAESVHDLLLVLAAEELAHDWIFAEGAQIDHATGAELEPEPRQWPGLPIDELAQQILHDIPGPDGTRHYDGRFVELLLCLQSVLRISRGESGSPRYQIGLKGLAARIAQHAVLGPQLRRTHACLASTTLDAIDGLSMPGADTGERDQMHRAFEAGCTRLLSHIRLAHTEPLAARWKLASAHVILQETFIKADNANRLNIAIAYQDLTIFWLEDEIGPDIASASATLRDSLARAYTNRGIAKQSADGHGPKAAIADYDLAIRVLEKLRDDLLAQDETAWTPDYRNTLASAYMNRGIAKRSANGHGPKAAITDYDLAIRVLEKLRDDLLAQDETAWTPDYRDTLASAYMNRGNAKQSADGHGPKAAITDYDLAIRVREKLRDDLLAQDETAWTPDYRHGLALVYLNRARAFATNILNDKARACSDVTGALKIWRDLLERTPELAASLAGVMEYAADLARSLGCADGDIGRTDE